MPRQCADDTPLWGVSVRPHHYPAVLGASLPVVEFVAENYMFKRGGPMLQRLDQLCALRTAKILLHGVGMNIAGLAPLSTIYLAELKGLIERTGAELVSDHLCFTSYGNAQTYDLLPPVLDEASLGHVADRVQEVQQHLGCRLTLENISSYLAAGADTLRASEFLWSLAERTGCGVLLDINNLYVNAHNHGFDAQAELRRFPAEAVTQYHIAGHLVTSNLRQDTHDKPVCDDVIALLARAFESIGPRPVILERDDNAPFQTLAEELNDIRSICESAQMATQPGRRHPSGRGAEPCDASVPRR